MSITERATCVIQEIMPSLAYWITNSIHSPTIVESLNESARIVNAAKSFWPCVRFSMAFDSGNAKIANLADATRRHSVDNATDFDEPITAAESKVWSECRVN